MPATRASEITDELFLTFDRAVALRAERGRLKDELIKVEKRLQPLMRETFGDHWWFGSPSPADEGLDVPRHHPIGAATQLDRDFPAMQRDREALIAAHVAWKQRRGRGDESG